VFPFSLADRFQINVFILAVVLNIQIPKFLHFIYGLNGDPFGLTDRIAIRSAHVHNPDWKIYFWCPAEPTGEQWNRLRDKTPLTIINVADRGTWNDHAIPHHQHRSDLLRHTLLYAIGGAYLDIDTITLAPFPSDWLKHDFVIGREYESLAHREQTTGLCNAVMFCKMYSRFQWLWLNEWQRFDGGGWNEYSVKAPWRLHLENPGLCHVVDWQILGPMHPDKELYWQSKNLLANCVVAHLWRTFSQPMMDALSEEVIRSEQNAYCIHAKTYL
jgi:hypothetical protein